MSRYDRARNNLQKSAGYDVARALAQRREPRPWDLPLGSGHGRLEEEATDES